MRLKLYPSRNECDLLPINFIQLVLRKGIITLVVSYRQWEQCARGYLHGDHIENAEHRRPLSSLSSKCLIEYGKPHKKSFLLGNKQKKSSAASKREQNILLKVEIIKTHYQCTKIKIYYLKNTKCGAVHVFIVINNELYRSRDDEESSRLKNTYFTISLQHDRGREKKTCKIENCIKENCICIHSINAS